MKNPFEEMSKALALVGKYVQSIAMGALFVAGVIVLLIILVFPLIMCSITGNWTWIFLFLPILSLLIYITKD